MLGSGPGQGWWEGDQLTQVGAKFFHCYVEASSPCYSKRDPWTTSTGITWELVRKAESQTY